MALEDGVLVVGAPSDDTDMGSDTGSASVFRVSADGLSWTFTNKLTAAGGLPGTMFGSAVAIAGDYVAAGAPEDNEVGSAAGAAYVYLESDCPPGSYVDDATSTCHFCMTGTFANATNAPACQACAVNTFANESASTACFDCAELCRIKSIEAALRSRRAEEVLNTSRLSG